MKTKIIRKISLVSELIIDELLMMSFKKNDAIF